MFESIVARAWVFVAKLTAAIRSTVATTAYWQILAGPFIWLWRWIRVAWVTIVGWIQAFFRWILHPKIDSPLDLLKHVVSVVVILMGFMTIAWTAKQIAYPPLVITVAKLPDPIEKEYWVNPELARTLIDQIERIRSVVKGDRDPTFEAVLSPPNISISTGGWSLNVQEQILTPLASLFGRGQGEVHLSLTCYHPGCARTADNECRDLIPKSPDTKAPGKQYLCLRLVADIQRGANRRRLTPRLVLGNDDADLTQPLARVAEAVTAVSDPATAALYFYRRMREESAAAGSFVIVPDVVAELFNEASKAADQAEFNDSVSACWAHAVRAQLAIDRREFGIARIYLARARGIRWWEHLLQTTLPVDCERLIAIAEMEFARQLARRPRLETEAYLTYADDRDDRRVLAAYLHIRSVAQEMHGSVAAWMGFLSRSASAEDVRDALELTRSEIGLGLFSPADQCRLLKMTSAPDRFEYDPDLNQNDEIIGRNAEERDRFAERIWNGIRASVSSIENPAADELAPLTRQATLNFLLQYAINRDCTENVVALAERLFLNHANDQKVTQLLIGVTEAAALKRTELLNRPAADEDRNNPQIENLRKIYQRMVDTGADRNGVAINRLAFIAEAKRAEAGHAPHANDELIAEALQNLNRAWRRYQRERFPADSRQQAEFAVAFWGAVLMRSYPVDILTADLSRQNEFPPSVTKEDQRSAMVNNAEFQSALQALFPGTPHQKLSDLPQLPDIGVRIGCMCMLSYVTQKNELADFFITRLNRWQQIKIELPVCRRDLIPRMQLTVRASVRNAAAKARAQLASAEKALKASELPSKDVRIAFDKAEEANRRAQQTLEQATEDARLARGSLIGKREAIMEAERICYMAPKPEREANAERGPQ